MVKLPLEEKYNEIDKIIKYLLFGLTYICIEITVWMTELRIQEIDERDENVGNEWPIYNLMIDNELYFEDVLVSATPNMIPFGLSIVINSYSFPLRDMLNELALDRNRVINVGGININLMNLMSNIQEAGSKFEIIEGFITHDVELRYEDHMYHGWILIDDVIMTREEAFNFLRADREILYERGRQFHGHSELRRLIMEDEHARVVAYTYTIYEYRKRDIKRIPDQDIR